MSDERLIKDRRTGSPWKKFSGPGITAFIVIAAAVFLIFILLRFDEFSELLSTITRAMSPVIIGAILAYLMNPLMVFFENGLKRVLLKHAKRITKVKKFCRVVSLTLTILIFASIITVISYMLIPELTNTIMGSGEGEDATPGLVQILPEQAENLRDWIEKTISGDSKPALFARKIVESATTYLEDLVNNKMFNYTSDILGYVASGVWSVFGIVYDIVIGIFFSIYMLLAKDTFGAHAKKITFAIFKRRRANAIIRITKKCHYKFTGAITGKIVDSVIIGVICFVGMLIMNMPYRVLISVIVAVTNVIPFFGPYIGGVPSLFLLLCVDPWQALYFLIFIVILQQFDCNYLTPRIVGDSIGLSAFWVLFACVVFGALFGLPGMLLGVPSMACIYMIIKEIVEYKLKRKGLDPDTQYYMSVDNVDEQELLVVDPKNEPVTISPEEYDEKMRAEAATVEDDEAPKKDETEKEDR